MARVPLHTALLDWAERLGRPFTMADALRAGLSGNPRTVRSVVFSLARAEDLCWSVDQGERHYRPRRPECDDAGLALAAALGLDRVPDFICAAAGPARKHVIDDDD